MALSKKQIKFIAMNRPKLSAEKIAKELNIPVEEVQKLFDENIKGKTPFYFYVILTAIPILFFVLLEIGLRFFDYGEDLSMWTPATEGKIILNANVARRYFTNVKNIPSSIEDVFDSAKAPNSFRVFVLGESSAAGYPYMPLGSFSRYIRKRLELAYPNNKIEVINIGLTAVNSYTIRDFIPGVLEHKPDLILIYTGHNEYYGALGVGSMESIGSSRAFTNSFLYLNKFKITQLLRNFIQWFSELISNSDQQKKSGTLMSRMAKEQTIELDSESYRAGIDQFESNVRDVIKQIQAANVPLIIGTLASNLKDQAPFISTQTKKYPQAKKVFVDAQASYKNGDYKIALQLFQLAKDLDALRFRAPEEINRLVNKLGKEYLIPIVKLDSLFNAESPNGIVGNNLMTDHLHPTLRGFQLMGKAFFEKMIDKNFLPKSSAAIPFEKQDSATLASFLFSKIDSTMAEYRIKILKNDWPYIAPMNKIPFNQLLKPKTFEDSLAFKFMNDEITWTEAHQKAAEKYLKQKNLDGFLQHMEILLYQYPVIVEFYKLLDEVAFKFMKADEFEKAYKILLKRYQIEPNAFSAKWLGSINLNNGKVQPAIKYLEESAKYDPDDLQTLYNLAGAYALNKEYKQSYDVISKVLSKDQNYPGAQNLMQQLNGVLKK